MTYQLSDIFLGHNDGRKEALLKPDFENYFYDYQNIIRKTLEPQICLVLGRKGTGKSLLGEYIAKTANSTIHHSQLVSFKEFRFHQLRELKTEDITPNEYIAIWTWILLIELSKLLLTNTNLSGDDRYIRLKKFIEGGYSGLLLSQHSDNDLHKLKHVEGSYLRINQAPQPGSYLNFISDLENLVEQILEVDLAHSYTLVLDELDDRFANEEIYKNGLISLIKASDRLNMRFLRKSFKTKFLLLLRMDIFSLLNDTDLNKLKNDSCVVIDWGSWRKSSYESPLFDLIVKKIKTSIPSIEALSKDAVVNQFFAATVGDIPTGRYLLERTFFRPRDIITYLNLVKKEAPNYKNFVPSIIKRVERDYSEYFFDEIRNELKGHITDEMLDEGTTLIRQFSKFIFSYKEIEEFEKQRGYLKHWSLREALELLFNFSIVGNKYQQQGTNKSYYTWKYRDERAKIDFDKGFVLHLGLRKSFRL